MVDYATCKRKDLIKAAKSKHVTVTSSRGSGQPSNADYIGALRKVELDELSQHSFRFMDLSPELRTQVYGELLMFKKSWTCHPQILAACKQIREEATNILYGNNLIEVKIWHAEVQAHGLRCGVYDPRTHDSCVGTVEWPDLLHRAQWVRVSLPQGIGVNPVSSTAWFPLSTVQQILHSLCSFLSSSNSLRSIEVELQSLSLEDSSEEAAHFMGSLTMLGDVKTKTIKLSESETVDLSGAAAPQSDLRADPSIFTNAISLWGQADRYETLGRSTHHALTPAIYYHSAFDRARNRLYGQLDRDVFFNVEWEKETASAADEMEKVLKKDLLPFLRREEARLTQRQEQVARLTADWTMR